MTILSCYASGFAAYYRRDSSPRCPYRTRGGCHEHEVSALEHGGCLTFDPHNPDQYWWPRSEDFQAEAVKHPQRPEKVAKMNVLIQAISRQRALQKVLWFRHGSGGELQFGSGQRLAAANIASLPNISAHFAPGGAIEFYACNTSLSRAFFQAAANRLRIIVKGFDSGVRWNLHWDGSAPHRFITSRGIDRKLPNPTLTCTPQ
jgi:hypothetical protein